MTIMRKTLYLQQKKWKWQFKKLKKHNAPGTDNIPAELFKYGGNELVKHLHTIIKEIWIKEKNANRLEFKHNLSHTQKGIYNGMFELQRCKSFKHSLQNIVQDNIYKNFTICRKHNWELSVCFPEEQIQNKPDIYTKTDIGKD